MGSSRARARDHITMRQLNLDHAIGVAHAIPLPLLPQYHFTDLVFEPDEIVLETHSTPHCEPELLLF
jgi:hypothetical protein